jgi:hypothetical protein
MEYGTWLFEFGNVIALCSEDPISIINSTLWLLIPLFIDGPRSFWRSPRRETVINGIRAPSGEPSLKFSRLDRVNHC